MKMLAASSGNPVLRLPANRTASMPSEPEPPTPSSPSAAPQQQQQAMKTLATNSVLIANLPRDSFTDNFAAFLRTIAAKYGPIRKFVPLKSFARCIVTYAKMVDACKARLSLEGDLEASGIEGARVYYADVSGSCCRLLLLPFLVTLTTPTTPLPNSMLKSTMTTTRTSTCKYRTWSATSCCLHPAARPSDGSRVSQSIHPSRRSVLKSVTFCVFFNRLRTGTKRKYPPPRAPLCPRRTRVGPIHPRPRRRTPPRRRTQRLGRHRLWLPANRSPATTCSTTTA